MKFSTIKWVGIALGFLYYIPLAGQGYGESVAVGNGEVIVGEPMNTMTPGYVYVYSKDSVGEWTEIQRLEASNSKNGDHFGRSLALAGNHLLVGSTTLETIYVFEKDKNGLWIESEKLQANEVNHGDYIGRLAAVDGDNVLIASWAHADARGAVYVFSRDNVTGRWSQSAKLMGSDIHPNEVFGMSLAIEGNIALIGSPRKNSNTGTVYVFRLNEMGEWKEQEKLKGAGTAPNSRFGQSVALQNGQVLIGASTHQRGLGIVFTYSYKNDSGEWLPGPTLKSFDSGEPGTQFGASVHFGQNEVWLGAPGASGFEGRIYSVEYNDKNEWINVKKILSSKLNEGDQFGANLAISDDIAVASAVEDDHGLGTVTIFERSEDGWLESTNIFSEPTPLDAVTGDQVDCTDGKALMFSCNNVDMISFLPVEDLGGDRGVQVNDLWGWTDPDFGREYALVGRYDGTAFVDVSNPSKPLYLGSLPMTEGARANSWRDIKVFKNYAFIVADGSGQHGMQIFDLKKLRNVTSQPVTFEEDAHYNRIGSAHNIIINEDTGFAYAVGVNSSGDTCGGGLHMIDIQDPLNPIFAGCFQDMSTGRQNTGYSHDAQCIIYNGPDEKHRGREICFGANETALSIADVTDKEAPVALSMTSYPNVGYSHQGWIDEEHEYFYMNDELDEIGGGVDKTRTLVWDVKDLDDPILVKEHFADNESSDHNLYIRGNLMYQSNYVSGLRILDISDRNNPELVGFFDTVPWSPDSPGFDGSWSNYPYFNSGIIVVNSGAEGMFILRKQERNLIP